MSESIQINIDSSQLNISNHGDFEITLQNDLQLNPYNKYLVYLHSAGIWNCWTNISASKGNNRIVINDGSGAGDMDFVLPDGAYNLENINEYLFNEFQRLSLLFTYDGDETTSPVQFLPNYATNRVMISMKIGWKIKLSIGNFYQLIGFDAVDWIATRTTTGQVFEKRLGARIADIEQGVDNLLIHCSLVSGSYLNGRESDVIFNTPIFVPQSTLMSINPYNVIPLKLNTHQVSSIRMRITDQSGNQLLITEPVSYCLVIQKA